MTQPLFRGAATALVTPLRDGKVDVDALRRLVEHQLENGVAALVSCGTTGEPSTLSLEERELVIRETVKAVNGRVPVICGTGANCTQTVIDNERRFRDLGCAAQLVVTPYYNKTSQEGLYAHFMAIAEHTKLPIILYNVPSRTTLEILPDTLRRLIPSGRFIALKEASANLSLVLEKLDAIDGRLTLYSGNDDLTYPLLAMGAEGVISVVSNVLPGEMAALCQAYFDGDAQDSLRRQIRLMPFIRALFREVSPIPCKCAMEMMGQCSGELRLPLIPAAEETRMALKKCLTGLGYLKS